MSNEKKRANSKKDFKNNTELKPSKLLKLVNRFMRMEQLYKRQK